MKLLVSAKDINNNILFEKKFDGNSFYESMFVEVSLKLKIVEPPIDYFKNNLAGLKLRKSYKLNSDEKQIVMTSNKIDEELKEILKIALSDNYVVENNILEIIDLFAKYKHGNLEDIRCLFEDNEPKLNSIKSLSFTKIE